MLARWLTWRYRKSARGVRNAVHAVPVGTGGVSKDTVDEARGCGRLPVYTVGEAGGARGVAEDTCKVRALTVYTDAHGRICGDSCDASSCSVILAIYTVLKNRIGGRG